jgi:hypothetical protein
VLFIVTSWVGKHLHQVHLKQVLLYLSVSSTYIKGKDTKVKFTLEQAMKVQCGSGGKALLFL